MDHLDETGKCILGVQCETGGNVHKLTKPGINALVEASLLRQDGLYVNFKEGVLLHTECRKSYTRKTTLKAVLRAVQREQPDGERTPLDDAERSTRSRVEPFDFRSMCLFCGENTVNLLKRSHDRRNTNDNVFLIRTIEPRTKLLKLCDDRGDEWADTVRLRLSNVIDLVASEGHYHQGCYVRFTASKRLERELPSGRKVDDLKTEAFNILCNEIENPPDGECQHSINELLARGLEIVLQLSSAKEKDRKKKSKERSSEHHEEFPEGQPGDPPAEQPEEPPAEQPEDAPAEQPEEPPEPEFYSSRNFCRKLNIKYRDRLITATLPGKQKVICLQEHGHKILHENWQSLKSGEESPVAIVLAATKFLRSEIQGIAYSRANYPTDRDIRTGGEISVPKLLQLMIDNIVLPSNRVPTLQSKKKSLCIQNCILAMARPNSYLSPLHLGLGVTMHRKFGSREAVEILHAMGYSVSYDEVLRYEAAATIETSPVIKEDAFQQYVFDNADHNTHTVDGKNTFHVLGGISCTSPSSSVDVAITIPRPKFTPPAEVTGKFGFIPIVPYQPSYEHGRGLKSIKIEDCTTEAPRRLPVYQAMDSLWLVGNYIHNSPQVGWNGAMSVALESTAPYITTAVLPTPFVGQKATDLSTLNSALLYASDQCKKLGQRWCIVTFDQPLQWKACQIVANAAPDSSLVTCKVRLGGFHLLMSYMGSIGYIMAGSGLAELLECVYAKNSVPHMLTGHHFARAYRAHMLTQFAIIMCVLRSGAVELDSSSSSSSSGSDSSTLLIDLYASFTSGNLSIEKLEESPAMNIHGKIRGAMVKFSENNRTAKLWLQYVDLIELMRLYIRAERTGDWDLHLYCVTEMLPYFHASGHHLYAKSAHLYLQQMRELPHVMTSEEYSNFTRSFTVRRTKKLWSGNWTDMTIEQVLMRSLKARGGPTRGSGMGEASLSKFIGAAAAVTRVIDSIEGFTKTARAESEQHKDVRDSNMKRDHADASKFIAWFAERSPFSADYGSELRSLASGVQADQQTNCDDAKKLGLASIASIVGRNFEEAQIKRTNRVRSLALVSSSATLRDEVVAIDFTQVLHRMVVAADTEIMKREALRHELNSRGPPALSDADLLLKNKKSDLLNHLIKNVTSCTIPSTTQYVIDGGSLLHCVLWQLGLSFRKIYELYGSYLKRYGLCRVVFDSYNSPSTKDSEHQRRYRGKIAPTMQFTGDMACSVTKAEFLANLENKQRFIYGLSAHLQSSGHTVVHAEGDADRDIVMTALRAADDGQHVTVVAQDTDVLVLLLAHTAPHQQVAMMGAAKKNEAHKFIDINTLISHHPYIREVILFEHAISGCDTTSGIAGKGKIKALHLLQSRQDMRDVAACFMSSSSCKSDLETAGTRFLLALYGAPQKIKSLEDARYHLYMSTIGRQSLTKSFNIAHLPPTSPAAHLHFYRTYHQVQEWLGNSLPPTDWGWKLQDSKLMPVLNTAPPAPEWLLKLASCGCKTGCTSARCGCRRAGLKCTDLCKHCAGGDCDNRPNVFIEEEDGEGMAE